MLVFAGVLAMSSFALEMVIAAKLPIWRKFAERYLLANMGLGLLLSACLGMVFGAVGLIALTAGVMSTLMSIPGYQFLHWNFDSELALRQGGNRLRYIWNESKLRLSHRIATAKQWCLLLIVRTKKLLKVFVRTISNGSRFMRWIVRQAKRNAKSR
jgi:hypothetical protein